MSAFFGACPRFSKKKLNFDYYYYLTSWIIAMNEELTIINLHFDTLLLKIVKNEVKVQLLYTNPWDLQKRDIWTNLERDNRQDKSERLSQIISLGKQKIFIYLFTVSVTYIKTKFIVHFTWLLAIRSRLLKVFKF